MPTPLVLASTSSFRALLLARLDIPFVTAKPNVDETPLAGELPEATALRLSERKAHAVANDYPGSLIIGSDQVAFLGHVIFGKPITHDNAVRQLQVMRGKTVLFATGLCLLNTQTDKAQTSVVMTEVAFRADLSDEEIHRYLQKDTPYACAGSAKSESLGPSLMDKMTSHDPTALVGLPLIALSKMLRAEGVRMP